MKIPNFTIVTIVRAKESIGLDGSPWFALDTESEEGRTVLTVSSEHIATGYMYDTKTFFGWEFTINRPDLIGQKIAYSKESSGMWEAPKNLALKDL